MAMSLRVEKLAPRYSFIVRPGKDRMFDMRSIELPGIGVTEGCLNRGYIALVRLASAQLEDLERNRRPLPIPLTMEADEPEVRGEQVCIRLTGSERRLLEAVAKVRGGGGLSEFFRNAALDLARSGVSPPLAVEVKNLVHHDGIGAASQERLHARCGSPEVSPSI